MRIVLCFLSLLWVCIGFPFRLEDKYRPVDIVRLEEAVISQPSSNSSRNLRGKIDIDKSKLHRCRDAGEAYSASFLITREHLLEQFTDYNLTWVNCEMGSFIFMNGRANPQKDVNGSLLQSLDVLDFSVIHLSTYERLLKRWKFSIKSNDATTGNIDPVRASAELLKDRALQLRAPGMPIRHDKFNRTVVIMPFLGTDMGAGHSKLSNRFQYLAACFWSFYADYPYVVVAVKSDKDRHFARYNTSLSFIAAQCMFTLCVHVI